MKRIATVLLIALLFAVAGSVSAQVTFNQSSQQRMVMTNLSSIPLTFTENRGQWDEKVLYRAEAGGATFWFCGDEIAYVFTRDTDELLDDDMHIRPDMPDELKQPRYKKESLVIRAQLIGANPDAEIIGEDRLSHNCNYFYGNEPSKWRTDVPNYSMITYKDIYPGIDLKYYGNGSSMKYDFIVQQGADMSRIAIRYEGVDNVSISNDGDLQLSTSFSFVYENKPYVYQEIDGRKVEREAGYYLKEPGVFGFEVDDYNPSLTLVIDPELVYSTYLGGGGGDYGYGIAVDASGNAYVTGETWSSDFPTENPYDGSYNGNRDAFVTKLSPAGNSLIYSTYLGGGNEDWGEGIAVDASGSAYVTGATGSSDFPTVNPYDESFNGYIDIFVAKLTPTGNTLDYSTYLGSSGDDRYSDIAVDDSGNAFVTGHTNSSDFPTVNPYDGSFNGGYDVFVAKLTPMGNTLVYSTFLGGAGFDGLPGIAVSGSGNAFVEGITNSFDFPIVNPYDGSYNGGDYDVFVTKLSSAGNSLIYSTYLGGSDDDWGEGITADGSGSTYVTGYTYSSDFPTVNPYDGSYNGGWDAFVTKLSPVGNSLTYSTYLGGSYFEYCQGIAVDGSGSAYVTGKTGSSDFPMVNPYDESYNDSADVFVTKLSPAGNSLTYSTYLGGSNHDCGIGIAIDGSGSAYVTGFTYSSNFPTINPYDGSYNGGRDAFVAKFGPEGEEYDLDFRPNPDGWGFGNTRTNMWSFDWNSGDPIDERCNCSNGTVRTCFPTWDLFRDAFGQDQTEEFVNGEWIRRPRAERIWNGLKDCWGGSCFGFAISSFLFFDDILEVSNEFPGYSDLYSVPIEDDSRLMINKFFFYQFGKSQKQHIRNNFNSSTPNQALQDVQNMFDNPIRDDEILVFYNNHGDGGHAVNPYKIETDQNNPDLRYIYVYDNNFPGEETWRFEINTVTDTWSYDGQPGWGGSRKIFLMDPVSNYMTTPILPSSVPPKERWIMTDVRLSEYIDIYVTTSANALLQSSYGTIGREDDSLFSTLSDGIPIIPITGFETPPIGYNLANAAWIAEFSGVRDSLFHFMIFTDSTVLACYRAPADSFEIEVISYPGDDSSFTVGNRGDANSEYSMEKISCWPDSELVIQVNNIEIGPQDSVFFSVTPSSGILLSNYSDNTSYNLKIELAGFNLDTTFYHRDIPLGANSSHEVIPGESGFFEDSLIILIDEGIDGVIDDTLRVENEPLLDWTYLPGDANMYNGLWPPQCIGSDVTYLVNYFRGVGDACELDGFWASADANGDCNIIGSDVTRLVNYFRGNVSLLYCPDYEPLWLTPDDLPDEAPDGWPNCETPVITSKVIPTGSVK